MTAQLVAPERDVSQQGHYAGAVTRLIAFLLDSFFVSLAFWLLSWLTTAAINTATGGDFDPTDHGFLTTAAFAVWAFLYFAYPLAVSGRTLGMAIVGIAVVRRDGTPIRPQQAALRTVLFPLSFLLFGLGYVGIVLDRERRALHDFIASTVVIYAWNAKAARLRFLAKR